MKKSNLNDIIKALKRSSRAEYGFVAPIIYRNKKKYTRKQKHRVDYGE